MRRALPVLLGLGLTASAASCRSDRSKPDKPKLSPAGEQIASKGGQIRSFLEPYHQAFPATAELVERPCPKLDGPAFNLSWGALNHIVTGEALDEHALHTADPLPFNDWAFKAPELIHGDALQDAGERELNQVERAHGQLDAVAYVRVAKTTRFVAPEPRGETGFEPGSLEGWLVVFDRDQKIVCSVRAEVESSEEVRIGGAAPQARATGDRASLLVDLTQQLARALRLAARPQNAQAPKDPAAPPADADETETAEASPPADTDEPEEAG